MTSTTDRPTPALAASFRLVGGKGGVGKTTCAAAMALAAARAGSRTLVISTDPAPSLGDALGQRLGPSPRPVRHARARLHAVEIDARRSLDGWLDARRARLERIVFRGTWLDREDVARLLRLSLPGIDEIAALFEIVRFARSGRFDLIVVDTAPTGHTLRLLSMPDVLRRVARVFDRLQDKHRIVASALTGQWRGDDEDRLIEELDCDGRELAVLLRDSARVRVSWVSLAEPMAVEETLDAVRDLRRRGIPLNEIIVNGLTPAPGARCQRCAAQRALEARALAALRKALPRVPLRAVHAHDREPVGVPALGRIGRQLERTLTARAPQLRAARGATWRARLEQQRSVPAALFAPGAARLLLFGGKGGVGKTTCAAAVAIDLAQRSPERRVLLLSTDPAHSLADALGEPVGDRARRIPGAPRSLRARELDAARGFETIRRRYAAAIDGMFERLSRGSAIDATHDRLVMQDLMDLAPPGVDELVAAAEVLDAVERTCDLVVMDTAPSGHALRLLETPALVHDWTKALMRIVLKYQPATGVGELGEILLEVSQRIGRLRALLADGSRCRFVAVTRAAALPRAETARLLEQIDGMSISTPVLVVNAFGKGSCGFCRRVAAAEAGELARLERLVRRRGAGERTIAIAPSRVPPPHRPEGLSGWRATWRIQRMPDRAPRARGAR